MQTLHGAKNILTFFMGGSSARRRAASSAVGSGERAFSSSSFLFTTTSAIPLHAPAITAVGSCHLMPSVFAALRSSSSFCHPVPSLIPFSTANLSFFCHSFLSSARLSSAFLPGKTGTDGITLVCVFCFFCFCFSSRSAWASTSSSSATAAFRFACAWAHTSRIFDAAAFRSASSAPLLMMLTASASSSSFFELARWRCSVRFSAFLRTFSGA